MMIGIYDSGIGGFSIYKSVKKLLPTEDFIYVADKKFFPYGTKPTRILHERGEKIISWFEEKKIKLIVIACNTSTVSSLKYLRTLHPTIPIIGTVPVIKTCVERSQNGNIGILCTTTTARSAYQKKLIAQFASDKNVYVKACPGFVESIENLNELSNELSIPLKYLKRKNIDTLALGCTHFSLRVADIQKIMGKEVLILDSGDAIARQVKKVLKNNKTLKETNKKTKGTTIFYTTANPKKFDIMIKRYCNVKFKSLLLEI